MRHRKEVAGVPKISSGGAAVGEEIVKRLDQALTRRRSSLAGVGFFVDERGIEQGVVHRIKNRLSGKGLGLASEREWRTAYPLDDGADRPISFDSMRFSDARLAPVVLLSLCRRPQP
jgi:hypothetical protein